MAIVYRKSQIDNNHFGSQLLEFVLVITFFQLDNGTVVIHNTKSSLVSHLLNYTPCQEFLI